MTIHLFTNLFWYLQFSSRRPLIFFVGVGILTVLFCYIFSPKTSSEAETSVAKLSCDNASPCYQRSPLQSTVSWAQVLAHWFISDTQPIRFFRLGITCLKFAVRVIWRRADPDLLIDMPVWEWQPRSAGQAFPSSALNLQNKSEDAAQEKSVDKCTFFPLWVMEKLPLPRKISFL